MISVERSFELIGKEELLSLVPHRSGMFLLDRINSYDLEEYSVEAEYDISENCLFFDSAAGGIPAWVCIEFIAQVISVLFGLKRREMGEKSRLGFLLSVSSMKTELPVFKVGSTVVLKAHKINCIDMIYTFDCSAFIEGKNVFKSKLTAIDVEDEAGGNFSKGEK